MRALRNGLRPPQYARACHEACPEAGAKLRLEGRRGRGVYPCTRECKGPSARPFAACQRGLTPGSWTESNS